MQELLEQALYYLDALWRRRWIALGLAFVIACGGWYYVAKMQNTYKSEAKIYVDTQSVLNPLLNGLTVETNVDQQIAVMRQTLMTRPNLEKIIRHTDMDLSAETDAQYQSLVESVRSRIRIDSNQTNIFTISFTDTKPQRASEVVDKLTTMFVRNNLGEDRRDMETAQSFLDRQIRKYEQQLNTAEAKLANFKQEHQELLPGETGLRDQFSQAQARLDDLKGKLSDARTRQDLVKDELAQTPEMLTQRGGQAGPPSNTEVKIMEVRGKLDELKARYTDQHPDVQAAQRRLDALKKELQAQRSAQAGPGSGPAAAAGNGGSADDGMKIPNPTYSQLKMQAVEVRSQIQTLEKQIARQEEAVAKLKQRLKRVPEVETKLKKLQRNLGMIRSRYDALLSRRENAELASERDEKSDKVQFRIIESAQVPATPEGPNRPIFMAAVMVMSLGAGAGSAGALALMKTSYGSVNHLRRDFDLPVVGAISALPSRYERLKKALEGIGLGLAGTGFIGLFAMLMLIERQVGLPTLLDGPVTPAALQDVLRTATEGFLGRSGA